KGYPSGICHSPRVQGFPNNYINIDETLKINQGTEACKDVVSSFKDADGRIQQITTACYCAPK
ncbi:hypothetical protein HYX01_03050, partial [Candidatus Woesearchaeota archaeon]|nr:hypothetical protein [Candidatus Woesearchaeota archaeon]